MITDNGLDIHLSEEMVGQIRKRGHGTSPGEITRTVCRWCGLVNKGADEVRRQFTEDEAERIVEAVAAQTRTDGLTVRELWEMGAERLAAIVAIRHGELYKRCLRLSELAAMWIKEEAGGRVAMRPGYGGRPKG